MNNRRAKIPQKRPFFLGCEGESEQAYGQLLNEVMRRLEIPVHIEVVNLNPGAGDPIARLRRAAKEITRRQSRRSQFAGKAILTDSDQVKNDHPRRDRTLLLAHELGIKIIWQEPCHEAFLLRHLPGCGTAQPPETRTATRALLEQWPDYRKPMTRVQLEKKIGIIEIQQAARFEPGLKEFLQEVRLPV